jgi:hypothetical protein
VIDNVRKLEGYGFKGRAAALRGRQDKGHKAQFEAYLAFLRGGGAPPVSFEGVVNTTLATFAAVKAFGTGGKIRVENYIPAGPELAARTP